MASAGIFGAIAAIAAAKGGAASQEKFPDYPAHFSLLGSYVRGTGEFLTPAGLTASPTALAAMGGASTGWLIDTERDLTFIFLSAGFIEGLAHPRRLQRLADLAIAAVKS